MPTAETDDTILRTLILGKAKVVKQRVARLQRFRGRVYVNVGVRRNSVEIERRYVRRLRLIGG